MPQQRESAGDKTAKGHRVAGSPVVPPDRRKNRMTTMQGMATDSGTRIRRSAHTNSLTRVVENA